MPRRKFQIGDYVVPTVIALDRLNLFRDFLGKIIDYGPAPRAYERSWHGRDRLTGEWPDGIRWGTYNLYHILWYPPCNPTLQRLLAPEAMIQRRWWFNYPLLSFEKGTHITAAPGPMFADPSRWEYVKYTETLAHAAMNSPSDSAVGPTFDYIRDDQA